MRDGKKELTNAAGRYARESAHTSALSTSCRKIISKGQTAAIEAPVTKTMAINVSSWPETGRFSTDRAATGGRVSRTPRQPTHRATRARAA
jgi:hypothetical protein